MDKKIVDVVKSKVFALRTVAVYDTRYLNLFRKVNEDELCYKMMYDVMYINDEAINRFNQIVGNFQELTERERENLRIK